MIEYDLHIHTTASDGLLKPEEIFKIAKFKKLKGISITDHDTVDALEYCKYLSQIYNIDFIPGIEISCFFLELEIHLLGYYIDYNNKNLLEFLKLLQESRLQRIYKMIDILKKLGYKIHNKEVELLAGKNAKSLGRPHIGRLLVEKGYFNNVSESFDKLLGNGKPAYVERYKIKIDEAVSIIKNSGGLPIIAHPFLISKNLRIFELEKLLNTFKEYGAVGIEVYHSKQSENQSKILLDIAKKNNLLITGGSDFHGVIDSEENILGKYGIDSVNFQKLKLQKR